MSYILLVLMLLSLPLLAKPEAGKTNSEDCVEECTRENCLNDERIADRCKNHCRPQIIRACLQALYERDADTGQLDKKYTEPD